MILSTSGMFSNDELTPEACFALRINTRVVSPAHYNTIGLQVGTMPRIASLNGLVSLLGKRPQYFLDFIRQDQLARADLGRATHKYRTLRLGVTEFSAVTHRYASLCEFHAMVTAPLS
jgi:hypothetical protein